MTDERPSRFITRVDLLGPAPGDYEVLNAGMLAARFFRHIVGGDNTAYVLPPLTYFSFGMLPAQRVKELAEQAGAPTGKRVLVLTVAVESGQAAWNLDPVVTRVLALDSQAHPPADVGTDLFEKVEKAMDKVRPLLDTTAKLGSDFGQLMVKGCTTLNAGALIAMPTLYKALTPATTAIPGSLYISCGSFVVGLLGGAVAGWSACIFISQASKMLAMSMMLPLLQAQKAASPETMDKLQLRQLEQAEAGRRRAGPLTTVGLWTVLVASLVSLLGLVAGASFGGAAILGARLD